MKQNPQVLILIYLLSLLGYIFTRGFYSFGAFTIMLFSFTLFFTYYFKPATVSKDFTKLPLVSLCQITLIVSILLSVLLYGGLYQTRGSLYNLSRYLLLVCSLVSVTYLLGKKYQSLFSKYRFYFLFSASITIQIFIIISSTKPIIDIFEPQKQGINLILSRKNPYSTTYPQVYPGVKETHYFYLPLTIAAEAPFNIILSDPRFTLVFANSISAIIMYKLLKSSKTQLKETIPLIFLFHPHSSFMVEQSWVDPIIFASLALYLYLAQSKKNWFKAGIALAFAAGIKLHFPILFIFSLFFKKVSKKTIVTGVLIVSISLIPFVFLSPHDLYDDVFRFLVTEGPRRYNGLTVSSFIFEEFKSNIPFIVYSLTWLFVFARIIREKTESFSLFTLSLALWFYAFYFLNYIAYINYYAFISSLLLLSLSFYLKENQKIT